MNTYTITSIRESGISVRIEILTANGEVKRHRMTSKLWGSFGFSRGDAVSKEDYLKISDISERCEAVTHALRLLSEQTLSCRKLREKLHRAGISEDAADDAVAVALKRGLIDERSQAEEYALKCAETKFRGRLRITAILVSHGYPPDTAKSAANKVPQAVYYKGIKKQLSIRCPEGIPDDKTERDKLIATMNRQGFTVGEILSVIGEK